MRIEGTKGRVAFTADTGEPATSTVRICALCHGLVRRSHRTGILHRHCFTCRYLRMIYGPNIGVRRVAK